MNLNNDMLQDQRIEEEENAQQSHVHVEITPEQKELLIEQAKAIKTHLDSFEQEFNNPDNEFFYIISAQWLRLWKKYTSFESVIANSEVDSQHFGQIPPGKVNEDIVRTDPKFALYPDPDDYRNVFLKEEMQEKADYELITPALWSYISEIYEGIAIKRPVFTTPNGMRFIEVNLKQLQTVPVTNSVLKDVDHKRIHDFKVFIIQASSQTPLIELKNDLAQLCTKYSRNWLESIVSYSSSNYSITETNIRLWKVDPDMTLQEFFRTVKEVTEASRTYDYQIEFKGNFLEKEKEVKLADAQIAADDYVVLEVKEPGKGWNFHGDGAPILSKCEFCNKFGELTVQCSCKKVAYCSEDCKNSDKRFHRSRCDKAGEDEEQESKQLARKPDSKMGLVGLQNLGNTCFMNSGLQCMSNVFELTEYFLTDKYEKEINETNALGTKGKLVRKYAAFLKHLWFGTSSTYSPWALKQGISEFQSMFSGYQQHDSQELLAFLIDGIHEDLNRVRNKPFTETIESENEPDYEVAMKSWQNHLKRNQSVIVDLFHGQFKSQITCPTCNRVSITFDPFNSVSLPIPVKKEKEIDFYFIHANNKQKAVKLAITYPKTNHFIKDLKRDVAKRLKKNPDDFDFVFATYHTKEKITNEDTTTTNEIRKKKRFKNLFAFELPQEDLQADPNDRFDVDIHPAKKGNSYYSSDSHKHVSFIRTVSLRKSYTIRQIYIKMFKYFRFLFDENWPEEDRENWLALSDEEAFDKIWTDAENKPFMLHYVTNSSMSDACEFCDERRCTNCVVNYDDTTTLADILAKIKDQTYTLEFEFVFNHIPDFVNLDNLNGFTDLTKRKASEEENKEGKESSNVNIADCFEQFELPEQLGEDNAWYCSKCKEHQKATKKMEIYKAPPILVLHFKRFKSGTSFYKKGKITQKVDFPIDDLDVSNFVINKELPTDYPVERIIPNFDPQPNDENTQNDQPETNQTMNIETDASQTVKENDAPNEMNLETPAATTTVGGLHYSLFAVVNHYGNMGFGHYTAYAKNHLEDKWFYFDDSRVAPETADSVCTPAAYVLFYKRKDWKFKI